MRAKDIYREIHQGLDEITPGRLKFIRKAFHMLPTLSSPRVLDVGCGRGGPTLELARLSGGEVLGVDTDGEALADLVENAGREGLSDRIAVRECSMSAMDFEDQSFDVIWAEGSIHAIGLEEGLDAWRRFLVPDGHVVIHEVAWLRPAPPAEVVAHYRTLFPGIQTVDEYKTGIRRQGFALIGDFTLPEDFWWENYYRLLEARLERLREKYRADPDKMNALSEQQREVDLYKKHSRWFGSAYFVLQRK